MPKISALPELNSPAGDDEIAIVDKSEGTTKKMTASNLFGTNNGWVASGETWVYSAYDTTTRIAEFTVASGAELRYTAGNRVRFDQPTDGTKYGIIHYVESTTIHIFMNIDYDVDNETISEAYYSIVKSPLGFDLRPRKWQLQYESAGGAGETTGLTAYQQLRDSILTIGVGGWDLSGRSYIEWKYTNATQDFHVGLSTSSTSVSDNTMYSRDYHNAQTGSAQIVHRTYYFQKYLQNTSDVTYYFTGKIANGGTEIDLRAGAYIRAVSSYL